MEQGKAVARFETVSVTGRAPVRGQVLLDHFPGTLLRQGHRRLKTLTRSCQRTCPPGRTGACPAPLRGSFRAGSAAPRLMRFGLHIETNLPILPLMESGNTYWNDRALLEWQIELGADEAIGDTPVNRYDLDPAPTPKVEKPAASPTPPAQTKATDPVAEATATAQSAATLEDLATSMAAFDHCELKRGARNFVFSDGRPDARVMIVGEAPGRQEDQVGKPFVGQAGQLLDKMLAAIDLDRRSDQAEKAVYITNVLPWRPPQNRTPDAPEIAMLLPFLERHITLANPDILILMGNTPCQALLGRAGITRIRGTWTEVLGRPTLPMFHPAYLLRQTAAKREAWADLLSLKAKLRELT